jgi:hypothetical protein
LATGPEKKIITTRLNSAHLEHIKRQSYFWNIITGGQMRSFQP